VAKSCDFESGICNWQPVKHDSDSSRTRFRRDPGDNNYAWARVRSSVVSKDNPLPSTDHTSVTNKSGMTPDNQLPFDS